MKFILAFVLLHFSITEVKAQTAIETKPFEIAQLSNNFFVYTTFKKYKDTFFPSNSLYVVTNDGIVLIDTPWDETQTNPLLDSIEKKHNKKVKLCVVTHYHDDRTAGLDILKSRGVKTYSSHMSQMLGTMHKEKTTELVFYKDTLFSLGEINFETFYPGPGHTKDNIVIWFPNQKILFGGCFVKSTENKSLGNIEDSDLLVWPLSVTNVISKYKKPNYVIPGHYGWSKKNSLKHTLKLLQKQSKN